MNRKYIQFVLLAFAIPGSLMLLGSQAGAKVLGPAGTGQSQGAAVASGGGTVPGALPAGSSGRAAAVSGEAVTAPLSLSCSTAYFGLATNFTVGALPEAVAAGDFNRDGILD